MNQQPSASNLLDIELQIQSIQKERQLLVLKRKEMDLELSDINRQFKSGIRFEQAEYKSKLKRQQAIKSEMFRLDAALRPLTEKLKEARVMRHAITIEIDSSRARLVYSSSEGKDSALVSLRDKYLNFAEDHTRINSMRMMAAQFANELTSIMAAS